jgi:hypothetical protein
VSPTGRRSLVNGELGSTVLMSGTVRVAEVSYAFSDRAMQEDPERAEMAWWTLRHELVHTLQALSCLFLATHSRAVRSQVGTFRSALQDHDVAVAQSVLTEIRRLDALLDEETGADGIDGIGVSVRQLMEGAALVEAERARSSVLTMAHLPRLVRDAATPLYGRAFGIVLRNLGPEPAMKLLPALVFVALNTPEPGEAFSGMVRGLEEWRPSDLARLGPADIVERSADGDRYGPLSSICEGPVTHNAIWDGLLGAWASSGPPAAVALSAACPSVLMGADSESLFGRDLVAELELAAFAGGLPLLTLYGDGRGRASRWVDGLPEGTITALFSSDELLGLMHSLALPERRFANVCSHKACPAHRFQVCQLAYPPAPEAHYEECGFRHRIHQLAGMPLESIVTVLIRRPSGRD